MNLLHRIIGLILLSLLPFTAKSQDLNWANLSPTHRHILTAQAGWDYSLGLGAGYAYQLPTKSPVLLSASFSFPFGETITDDFKTKVGGQMRLVRFGDFQLVGSIHGIYRRYENPLVSLQNLGAEWKGIIGYYKPRWFLAGELGVDLAIATHFNHSDEFRENNYQNLQDGWFSSTSGGNFNYGILGGYSFRRHDLAFKIGALKSQGFETGPMIPLYSQLSFNFKLGGDR